MRHILLTLVISCLLCSSYSAEAQQKAAFVVGNNNYREYPLKNAVNDADLMEATLQRLGFTVKKLLNASKADFERQMLAFNRDFANADIRFFYYAGHGIQLEGQNFLVPVDATLERKEDAKLECLPFSMIFSSFQDSKRDAMNIFVMDACRNDPFKNRSWERRGDGDRGLLLRKTDFTTGSYAAFSADNGQYASDGSNATNGLYTKVLAEEMLTPGVEINILFQRVRGKVIDLSSGAQTPVEENRLRSEGGYYFIPKSDSPAPTPVASAKTYYYYIDQNGNRSASRFDEWEIAESEMRNKNLYGTIYSNAGEKFLVEKPAAPPSVPTPSRNDNPPANNPVSPTAVNVASLVSQADAHYDNARYNDAISLYRQAAEQGDAWSQFRLGRCYAYGDGVTKDYTQAEQWYRKAAEQGHNQTIQGYRKAAEQGDAMAQNYLGYCYQMGYGVTQDKEQATYWYKKAADQGNENAKNNLKNMGTR